MIRIRKKKANVIVLLRILVSIHVCYINWISFFKKSKMRIDKYKRLSRRSRCVSIIVNHLTMIGSLRKSFLDNISIKNPNLSSISWIWLVQVVVTKTHKIIMKWKLFVVFRVIRLLRKMRTLWIKILNKSVDYAWALNKCIVMVVLTRLINVIYIATNVMKTGCNHCGFWMINTSKKLLIFPKSFQSVSTIIN